MITSMPDFFFRERHNSHGKNQRNSIKKIRAWSKPSIPFLTKLQNTLRRASKKSHPLCFNHFHPSKCHSSNLTQPTTQPTQQPDLLLRSTVAVWTHPRRPTVDTPQHVTSLRWPRHPPSDPGCKARSMAARGALECWSTLAASVSIFGCLVGWLVGWLVMFGKGGSWRDQLLYLLVYMEVGVESKTKKTFRCAFSYSKRNHVLFGCGNRMTCLENKRKTKQIEAHSKVKIAWSMPSASFNAQGNWCEMWFFIIFWMWQQLDEWTKLWVLITKHKLDENEEHHRLHLNQTDTIFCSPSQ